MQIKKVKKTVGKAETCQSLPAPDIAGATAKLSNLVRNEPAIRKVIKAAARIADFITDEDRAENAKVIRAAKSATHRYFDLKSKEWTESPYHKTRLAAVALELAYDEGLPVQRSVSISGSFQDAAELMETLNESPATSEALKMLSNMGIKVEAGDGDYLSVSESHERCMGD